MKSILNRSRLATSVLLALGCISATVAADPVADNKADLIEQKYQALKPDVFKRNEVLYYMEKGKIAFDQQEYDKAAQYIDKAIAGIELVYSHHPDAVKARQLMNEEKYKPFKGETYERAMAYYYRGLLDLMVNDYENARASFESGLLQDSMGQNRDFLQDFSTLEYLSGWAGRCAGFDDLSKQSFARAEKLNPALKAPPESKKTLIIGESGTVPFKYYNDDMGGELRYWQHPLDLMAMGQMKYGKSQLPVSEELYYQARTRGARLADQIAYAKANTKNLAASIGSSTQNLAGIAMAIVNITHLIPGLNLISLSLMGVGSAGIAATAAVSEFTDAIGTGVDIRQWKTLPNRIFIASSGNTAPKTLKYISFVDQYNQPLLYTSTVLSDSGKCQLVRSVHSELAIPQLNSWEAVQLKLSVRTFPVYGIEKAWKEVKNDGS